MDLLKPRFNFRPLEYLKAEEYALKQKQAHWLHSEVSMASDIQDWQVNLSEPEKKLIGNVLKGFTQTEVVVGHYWGAQVPKWFKKPEIQIMARCFADMEGTHTLAYSYLDQSLGLDDFNAFNENAEVKAKLDMLMGTRGKIVDPKSIARSLAIYSGFAEGVSLFSSFAILLYFSTRNLLKGVGQIVSWSIKDECFVEGTEILTEYGFVDFKDLEAETNVAQYNPSTKQISFVRPSRHVERYVDEDVVFFDSQKMPIRLGVTKNHELLQRWDYQASYSKQTAEQFNPGPKKRVPISGYTTTSGQDLSSVERFLIAVQADGYVSDRYSGELVGTVPVVFTFSKSRKIERMRWLLDQLGWRYKESSREGNGNKKDQVVFTVNVPTEVTPHKTLDWVKLSEISSEWANSFIEEIVLWDGWTPKGGECRYRYYSSTDRKNCDVLQAVASLCGKWVTVTIQTDDRSDAYSDVYRCYIHELDEKGVGCMTKKTERYSGMVRCVTVPTGAIIVRYKGAVSVVGNCLHAEAGCWLFNTLCDEQPGIREAVEGDVIAGAKLVVQLEHDFIDMCFANGQVEGLNPHDIKMLINARANTKLEDLGYNPIFETDTEALERMSWFDVLGAGVEHQDFFAQRPTAYSKGAVDWSSAW